MKKHATAAWRCIPFSLLLCSLMATFFFTGCKKELNPQDSGLQKTIQPGEKPDNSSGRLLGGSEPLSQPDGSNPLSLRNILNASSPGPVPIIPTSQQLLYLRINPDDIGTEVTTILGEDSTITVMEFPFADGRIYGDSVALTEQSVEALKDGYLYALVPFNNNVFDQYGIPNSRLDTLYMPQNDEDTLMIASLQAHGYLTEEGENLSICHRRPEGYVRYTDTELGANQPVIRIQVTALFFGFPIHTHTNETGWFRVGWRFFFGTIITTKAVNDRVHIKPVNTTGLLWPITMIPQFIVGSVHIHGWVSCRNLDNININFTSHKQNRFWAHLLNAFYFNDQFTQSDGILQPPQHMVIWAHWGKKYGRSSCIMFGHIPGTLASLIYQYISMLFGVDITNYPNLLNTLLGFLPDLTIKTGQSEHLFYSSDLMQTAYHELGHSSMYRAVGNDWWKDLEVAELFPNGNCGNYGCGTGNDDGLVAVAESWAEFIGTLYADRRYPVNGHKYAGTWGLIDFNWALEYQSWFANDWIPTGIYNDLQDDYNSFETEDVIAGATIHQMFSCYDENIRSICDYYDRFTMLYYSLYPPIPVRNIFVYNGATCW